LITSGSAAQADAIPWMWTTIAFMAAVMADRLPPGILEFDDRATGTAA
jgi:hypothetical protein